MEKETTDDAIEVLRNRGLTCSRLKALENRELRDRKIDYDQAQVYRKYGFLKSADTKEQVAKVQGQLATQVSLLRKKVCGLR